MEAESIAPSVSPTVTAGATGAKNGICIEKLVKIMRSKYIIFNLTLDIVETGSKYSYTGCLTYCVGLHSEMHSSH